MTDTTSPGPGQGLDLNVLALSRVLDRTGRRVARVEALLDDLGADVITLAARDRGTPAPARPTPAGPAPAGPGQVADGGTVAGPADSAADGPQVRSWLLATDPDQARADLSDLIGWLYRVYLRYDGAGLCSCWLWHPDVVEELWWLRQAHADAYDPEVGSWLRVADWHERHRPGVVKRVAAVVKRCELSLHAQDAELDRAADAAPLAVHTDQIATAWTTDPAHPVPLPSAVQLDEADRADRAQNRARR